ncbi:MAG: helix-turn-helix transcriptional regulator [Aliihoeflea sp.]|uniref:helix-turn-helix transcriptional regulator n=1 Tax=Aliihoeflea sp. TaxID=2608088 RepID=UPI004033B776
MTEAFSTFRTDRIASSGLRELGVLMRGFSRRIGADAYLLFEHRPQTGSVGLIACDWPFDMIAEIGSDGLDRLARAGIACAPGDAAGIVALDAASIPSDISAAARDSGYASIICQSLPVGEALFVAVYCAGDGTALCTEEAELAQMRAIYAISQRLTAKAEIASPLSVREKECLSWVAEGKTTEEVAIILGVSANTINAYIAKAIQKVAATNRAMAIATAIRAGMI